MRWVRGSMRSLGVEIVWCVNAGQLLFRIE